MDELEKIITYKATPCFPANQLTEFITKNQGDATLATLFDDVIIGKDDKFMKRFYEIIGYTNTPVELLKILSYTTREIELKYMPDLISGIDGYLPEHDDNHKKMIDVLNYLFMNKFDVNEWKIDNVHALFKICFYTSKAFKCLIFLGLKLDIINENNGFTLLHHFAARSCVTMSDWYHVIYFITFAEEYMPILDDTPYWVYLDNLHLLSITKKSLLFTRDKIGNFASHYSNSWRLSYIMFQQFVDYIPLQGVFNENRALGTYKYTEFNRKYIDDYPEIRSLQDHIFYHYSRLLALAK